MASNELLPPKRRRKIFIICGSDGGDTLYVGAPSSEVRVRLYNKEVQSEDTDYTRCWRYECVYRNDRATSIAAYAYSTLHRSADVYAGIVARTYQERGIDTPWHANRELPRLPLVKTLPSDVEKRLWWLEHQVKPALAPLLERGLRDTILVYLGLSEELPDNR